MDTITSAQQQSRDHAHAHGTHPRTGLWAVLAVAAILAVVAMLWAAGVFAPQPRVALVTASQGPYWDLIVQGARDAADRHGVRLDVKPATDEPSQSMVLDALLGENYEGVAVSPNDSIRQARSLAAIGAQTNLVTFDADAAISRRLCFVGTDNYDAGRMCGQHVREALPDGGKVILAIGSMEKENGQRRRQGVIDELLGRSFEPNRPMDPAEGELKGDGYTIVATLVDNLNADRATQLAAEAIKSNPDAACFVGLFASNTPAILKALEQAGKLGQIKVVGFDANDETVAGIEKGYVYASIVQDAYNIGYYAVRILADAARGEPNAVPLFPTFHLRCDPWTKDNLREMVDAKASRIKPTYRPAAGEAVVKDAATQPSVEQAVKE
jgi:ribose transport system substrate-binding protein